MPRRLTRQTVHRAGSHASLLPWLALVLLVWLAGCASAPERPETLRQALLGLGQQAAERVAEAPALSRETLADQVLLLSPPQVDEKLELGVSRVQESLTRGLLAIDDGPQVLDWQPGDTPAADGCRCYVGNLAWETNEESLIGEFQPDTPN